MESFAEAGGQIYTCLPCFNKRDLDENNLVQGAVIVGGPKLVAFMASGAPSVSY
jgi:predicted peroxiredoxin